MKKTLEQITQGLLLIAFLISTNMVLAQHNHGNHGNGGSHEATALLPPNGGELKEIGKYKIEMVTNLFLKKDKLTFYVFKNNLKPIPIENITGTITFEYKDGTTSADSLEAKGDAFFVAQLENTDATSCTVSFIIKGKIVSTIFNIHGLKNNIPNNYSCPMHSEIKSNEKGKCPKCGMNLERQ